MTATTTTESVTRTVGVDIAQQSDRGPLVTVGPFHDTIHEIRGFTYSVTEYPGEEPYVDFRFDAIQCRKDGNRNKQGIRSYVNPYTVRSWPSWPQITPAAR